MPVVELTPERCPAQSWIGHRRQVRPRPRLDLTTHSCSFSFASQRRYVRSSRPAPSRRSLAKAYIRNSETAVRSTLERRLSACLPYPIGRSSGADDRLPQRATSAGHCQFLSLYRALGRSWSGNNLHISEPPWCLGRQLDQDDRSRCVWRSLRDDLKLFRFRPRKHDFHP